MTFKYITLPNSIVSASVSRSETAVLVCMYMTAQRFGRKTLVCAGDAINDLSMLEEADIAFVPTSCDDRIRGLGFRDAASCTEGTIADVIRQLNEEYQ